MIILVVLQSYGMGEVRSRINEEVWHTYDKWSWVESKNQFCGNIISYMWIVIVISLCVQLFIFDNLILSNEIAITFADLMLYQYMCGKHVVGMKSIIFCKCSGDKWSIWNCSRWQKLGINSWQKKMYIMNRRSLWKHSYY